MSPTVIITGGSSGIGRAVAAHFLKEGAHVVLGGRDAAKVAAVAQEFGAPERTSTVVGDARDKSTGARLVAAAVDATGQVDVLVNSAGTFGATPFTDITDEELDEFVSINLKGTFLATQAVVRRLKEQGTGGSIVSIGTVLTQHSLTGFPAAAPLVAKGGVQALTIALAAELAPEGIRVNMVAPGIVRTPLHPADGVDALGGLAMLDRVAEADEIASAVAWLSAAEFVTGHLLNVDGGFVTGRR